MNLPALISRVAFGSPPDVALPSYVDVSDCALEFRSHRGRSNERAQTDPGTAQVTYTNRDRRFDPTNAASVFAPNVVPMVKMQHAIASPNLISSNSSFENGLTGWAKVDGNASSTATAVTSGGQIGAGALQMVNTAAGEDDYEWVRVTAAPSTVYTVSAWLNVTAFTGGAVANRGLFAIGSNSGVAVGGQQNTTITATTVGWVRASVTMTTPATANQVEVRLYSPQGTVLWDGVQVEPGSVVSPYIGDAGTVYYLHTGYVENWPLEWDAPSWQKTSPTVTDSFAALEIAQVGGTFPQQTTGARITAVLAAISWPSVAGAAGTGWTLGTSTLDTSTLLAPSVPLTSIDAGLSVMQGVTIAADQPRGALDMILEAAAAEPGVFYIAGDGTAVFGDRQHRYTAPVAATFSDTPFGSDIQYEELTPNYDIAGVINDVIATTTISGVATTATASNPASVNRFFRRSTTLNVPLTTQADLQDRARFELTLYAYPFVRFDRLVVKPAGQPSAWPTVLGLEIGSKVTITRTPAQGTTITRTCFVESVDHTVTRDDWTVAFQLSPGEPFQNAWQLGTSALDTNTTVVY